MNNLRQLLIERLEKYAKTMPAQPAIEGIDETLTYLELANLVKSRSYFLRQRLGTNNLPVAIRLKDKKEVLITMLALIKAGKALLPLPYEIPEDKVIHIIKTIGPQALITEKELQHHDIGDSLFIPFETLQQFTYQLEKDRDMPVTYRPENIFCILMTSGTTGMPKGCQLSDQAFLGRIFDLAEAFPMTAGDKFLFSGNYSFDVTFTQMFCWLFGEGTIVIQDERDKFNKIPRYIEQFRITHIAISPAILRHIYEELKAKQHSLKFVFVAGEKFPVEIAEKYVKEKPHFELFNLYGPTEFSIYATKFAVTNYKKEKTVAIGAPFQGVKVYLLDEKGCIIEKPNTEGELVLAGKGMFNGYLNNPKENKEKILQIDGQLAYKTGDLGYYAENQYYLIGRKDHQFKINGVRIEAEEIEKKLLQHNPLIREAVVSYEPYHDKQILVAYISWKDKEKKIADSQIIQNVENSLEKYFLPKLIVSMAELPLNKNGKVDRAALQQRFHQQATKNLTNQQFTKKESHFNQLKTIWESVLQFPLTDETADFFLSGGDSVDGVVLLTEIEEKFGLTLSEEEFIGHSKFKQLLTLINVKMGILSEDDQLAEHWTIDWADLGGKIINDAGKKILVGEGEEKLYELINASLPLAKQADKIFIRKNEQIVQPQVVQAFPLFSRQEFYLRKNFNSILQTVINFDQPNYAKLMVALNKFVKHQQLTRCLIMDRRFVELAYSPIKLKDLAFIDLAFLQPREAECRLNEKLQAIHAQLLQQSPDKQMLQFLLVRESFKSAQLYLLVSHHIADAASIHVFKNQLLAYYQKNEENPHVPSYASFVNSVIATNNEQRLIELAESNYYREIQLANDSFRAFFNYDTTCLFDEYRFTLTTKNREDRANQLFAQLAKLVHQKTGAPVFAFQILKNLRNFANVDYKELFADIHCSIYTTYHIDKPEDERLFSKSEQNFKAIYEKAGIHIDYLTSSDKFVDNPFIPTFEETFLNINYLGEIYKEEVPSLIEQLRRAAKQLAKLHTNKVRFTCFTSGDKGYLIALGGMSLKAEI